MASLSPSRWVVALLVPTAPQLPHQASIPLPEAGISVGFSALTSGTGATPSTRPRGTGLVHPVSGLHR